MSDTTTQDKTWKSRLRRFWRQQVVPLAILVVIFTAVRSAVADWNDVPTGSMEPTIIPGDRIFVNKLAYDLKVPYTTWHLAKWADPHRGDVVIFFSPADGTRLVKRVVGVPGDTIALREDRLYVNGQPADYGPLDVQIANQVDAAKRGDHEFATESIGGSRHPVMASPLTAAPRNFGPVTVPAGAYFMMGDNRDNSFDSRFYGAVDRRRIVGRAVGVVLSLDRNDHYLPRWDRFFSRLP